MRLAIITIRNLDDVLKRRLRIWSAEHGRSMEQEARDILRLALAQPDSASSNLANGIRRRFATVQDIELSIPERDSTRSSQPRRDREGRRSQPVA